jgi:hypothetical protein
LIKQKVLFSSRSSTCFITKNHGHHYFIPKRKVKVKCRSNFDSWGGMLSPVDYQEFSWKYINQIVEALADDDLGNCFRKRMLVRSWRNGKSRASALELTGLARLEMQDIFWWKHHFRKF